MTEPTSKDDFIFTWVIEDFINKSDLITSPEFTVGLLQNTVWCMDLYQKSLESDKFIELHLQRKNDTGPESITVNYEISIIAADGTNALSVSKNYLPFLRSSTHKIPKIMTKSNLLSNASPNNTLTIEWRMWSCFNPKSAYNRCTAVTQSQSETVSFKKYIENSGAFYSGTRVIIPLPLSEKYEMIVRMERSDFGECLVISIRKNNRFSHRLFCKLSLLSLAGIPLATKEEQHVFENGEEEWRFPPFAEFEELKAVSTFLKNETLLLHSEISVFTGKENSKIVEKKYIHPHEISTAGKTDSFKTLSSDLRIAYSEKMFTDVNLVVGKKSFHANRFLLSARSPFFKNIFQTDAFKSENGSVEITNVDAEIMEDFLNYLYTGSLEELNYKNAVKLFAASDKLMVPELKNDCRTCMKKNLAPSVACDILQIAKGCQDEELKSAAESCFYLHADEILASESWKRLVLCDVSLATEMLKKLTSKQ